MNLRNISHIKYFLFLILSFTFFECENQNKITFLEGIQCNTNTNLESLIPSFISKIEESEGFFTLKESNNKLLCESYNPEYSYKDKGIKLTYVESDNLFLVDEEVKNISNLSLVVENLLIEYLAKQGTQIQKKDIERFSKENSGFMFEISDFSENDNELSQNQSYSMLLLLKQLNCSIDEVRKNISKKLFNKEFKYCSDKEKKLIRNTVPKIFYVFYFKNYKAVAPIPAKT